MFNKQEVNPPDYTLKFLGTLMCYIFLFSDLMSAEQAEYKESQLGKALQREEKLKTLLAQNEVHILAQSKRMA